MSRLTVLEPRPSDIEYFEYFSAERIGNPSAYAEVYEARSEGERGPAEWVVKLARVKGQEDTFTNEYELLHALASSSPNVYTPAPVYLVRDERTRNPGLVMRRYEIPIRHALRDRDEQAKRDYDQIAFEKFVTDRLIEYVELLQQLREVGHVVTDRKADDLFLIPAKDGEPERLVVIDWNLVRSIDEGFETTQIERTGQIWYELLNGRMPVAGMTPLKDADWQHLRDAKLGVRDAKPVGVVSIGLRILLQRALDGLIVLDKLRNGLEEWRACLDAGLVSGDLAGLGILTQRQRDVVCDDLARRSEAARRRQPLEDLPAQVVELQSDPYFLRGLDANWDQVRDDIHDESRRAQLDQDMTDWRAQVVTRGQLVVIRRWEDLIDIVRWLRREDQEFLAKKLVQFFPPLIRQSEPDEFQMRDFIGALEEIKKMTGQPVEALLPLEHEAQAVLALLLAGGAASS
ncbi:MAG: hypothetical protein K8S97_14845, partial [Anaerolineae bacterium]|nr:hypothetical protein [Anaerolineae bacterium]